MFAISMYEAVYFTFSSCFHKVCVILVYEAVHFTFSSCFIKYVQYQFMKHYCDL